MQIGSSFKPVRIAEIPETFIEKCGCFPLTTVECTNGNSDWETTGLIKQRFSTSIDIGEFVHIQTEIDNGFFTVWDASPGIIDAPLHGSGNINEKEVSTSQDWVGDPFGTSHISRHNQPLCRFEIPPVLITAPPRLNVRQKSCGYCTCCKGINSLCGKLGVKCSRRSEHNCDFEDTGHLPLLGRKQRVLFGCARRMVCNSQRICQANNLNTGKPHAPARENFSICCCSDFLLSAFFIAKSGGVGRLQLLVVVGSNDDDLNTIMYKVEKVTTWSFLVTCAASFFSTPSNNVEECCVKTQYNPGACWVEERSSDSRNAKSLANADYTSRKVNCDIDDIVPLTDRNVLILSSGRTFVAVLQETPEKSGSLQCVCCCNTCSEAAEDDANNNRRANCAERTRNSLVSVEGGLLPKERDADEVKGFWVLDVGSRLRTTSTSLLRRAISLVRSKGNASVSPCCPVHNPSSKVKPYLSYPNFLTSDQSTLNDVYYKCKSAFRTGLVCVSEGKGFDDHVTRISESSPGIFVQRIHSGMRGMFDVINVGDKLSIRGHILAISSVSKILEVPLLDPHALFLIASGGGGSVRDIRLWVMLVRFSTDSPTCSRVLAAIPLDSPYSLKESVYSTVLCTESAGLQDLQELCHIAVAPCGKRACIILPEGCGLKQVSVLRFTFEDSLLCLEHTQSIYTNTIWPDSAGALSEIPNIFGQRRRSTHVLMTYSHIWIFNQPQFSSASNVFCLEVHENMFLIRRPQLPFQQEEIIWQRFTASLLLTTPAMVAEQGALVESHIFDSTNYCKNRYVIKGILWLLGQTALFFAEVVGKRLLHIFFESSKIGMDEYGEIPSRKIEGESSHLTQRGAFTSEVAAFPQTSSDDKDGVLRGWDVCRQVYAIERLLWKLTKKIVVSKLCSKDVVAHDFVMKDELIDGADDTLIWLSAKSACISAIAWLQYIRRDEAARRQVIVGVSTVWGKYFSRKRSALDLSVASGTQFGHKQDVIYENLESALRRWPMDSLLSPCCTLAFQAEDEAVKHKFTNGSWKQRIANSVAEPLQSSLVIMSAQHLYILRSVACSGEYVQFANDLLRELHSLILHYLMPVLRENLQITSMAAGLFEKVFGSRTNLLLDNLRKLDRIHFSGLSQELKVQLHLQEDCVSGPEVWADAVASGMLRFNSKFGLYLREALASTAEPALSTGKCRSQEKTAVHQRMHDCMNKAQTASGEYSDSNGELSLLAIVGLMLREVKYVSKGGTANGLKRTNRKLKSRCTEEPETCSNEKATAINASKFLLCGSCLVPDDRVDEYGAFAEAQKSAKRCASFETMQVIRLATVLNEAIRTICRSFLTRSCRKLDLRTCLLNGCCHSHGLKPCPHCIQASFMPYLLTLGESDCLEALLKAHATPISISDFVGQRLLDSELNLNSFYLDQNKITEKMVGAAEDDHKVGTFSRIGSIEMTPLALKMIGECLLYDKTVAASLLTGAKFLESLKCNVAKISADSLDLLIKSLRYMKRWYSTLLQAFVPPPYLPGAAISSLATLISYQDCPTKAKAPVSAAKALETADKERKEPFYAHQERFIALQIDISRTTNDVLGAVLHGEPRGKHLPVPALIISRLASAKEKDCCKAAILIADRFSKSEDPVTRLSGLSLLACLPWNPQILDSYSSSFRGGVSLSGILENSVNLSIAAVWDSVKLLLPELSVTPVSPGKVDVNGSESTLKVASLVLFFLSVRLTEFCEPGASLPIVSEQCEFATTDLVNGDKSPFPAVFKSSMKSSGRAQTLKPSLRTTLLLQAVKLVAEGKNPGSQSDNNDKIDKLCLMNGIELVSSDVNKVAEAVLKTLKPLAIWYLIQEGCISKAAELLCDLANHQTKYFLFLQLLQRVLNSRLHLLSIKQGHTPKRTLYFTEKQETINGNTSEFGHGQHSGESKIRESTFIERMSSVITFRKKATRLVVPALVDIEAAGQGAGIVAAGAFTLAEIKNDLDLLVTAEAILYRLSIWQNSAWGAGLAAYRLLSEFYLSDEQIDAAARLAFVHAAAVHSGITRAFEHLPQGINEEGNRNGETCCIFPFWLMRGLCSIQEVISGYVQNFLHEHISSDAFSNVLVELEGRGTNARNLHEAYTAASAALLPSQDSNQGMAWLRPKLGVKAMLEDSSLCSLLMLQLPGECLFLPPLIEHLLLPLDREPPRPVREVVILRRNIGSAASTLNYSMGGLARNSVRSLAEDDNDCVSDALNIESNHCRKLRGGVIYDTYLENGARSCENTNCVDLNTSSDIYSRALSIRSGRTRDIEMQSTGEGCFVASDPNVSDMHSVCRSTVVLLEILTSAKERLLQMDAAACPVCFDAAELAARLAFVGCLPLAMHVCIDCEVSPLPPLRAFLFFLEQTSIRSTGEKGRIDSLWASMLEQLQLLLLVVEQNSKQIFRKNGTVLTAAHSSVRADTLKIYIAIQKEVTEMQSTGQIEIPDFFLMGISQCINQAGGPLWQLPQFLLHEEVEEAVHLIEQLVNRIPDITTADSTPSKFLRTISGRREPSGINYLQQPHSDDSFYQRGALKSCTVNSVVLSSEEVTAPSICAEVCCTLESHAGTIAQLRTLICESRSKRHLIKRLDEALNNAKNAATAMYRLPDIPASVLSDYEMNPQNTCQISSLYCGFHPYSE